MKKQHYETPTTETLVVRFEGVICGSDPNRDRSNSASRNYTFENDLGDLDD